MLWYPFFSIVFIMWLAFDFCCWKRRYIYLIWEGNQELLLFIFSIKNFLINFSIKFFHRTFSLYSCTLISKLEIILGLHCISKEAWFCFVFILNNILLSFVFSKLLWYQNFSLIFFFQLVSATICLLLIVCLLKLLSYNLEKFM